MISPVSPNRLPQFLFPIFCFLYSSVGITLNGQDYGRLESGLSVPVAKTTATHQPLLHKIQSKKQIPERKSFTSTGLRQYQIFPQAGIVDRDMLVIALPDTDSSSNERDPFCGNRTIDGNEAVLTAPLYYAQETIGTPVFAPTSGTVISVVDGQSAGESPQGNFVVLEHSIGQFSGYFYLKSGSINVAVGETVVAGQQIAEVGSSGNAVAPSLSFESLDLGNYVQPFSGTCGAAESLFKNQPVFSDALRVHDFFISNEVLSSSWSPPHFTTQNTGRFSWFGQSFFSFAIPLANVPTGTSYYARILRPSGQVAIQSETETLTRSFLSVSPFWTWDYDFSISDLGNWKIQVVIDGQVRIEAPFEVIRDTRVEGNAPPLAQAVEFEATPTEGEPAVCKIANSLIIDDLDYDLVRYRYQWLVNGNLVRDVTSAAQSDVLQEDLFARGDNVVCTMTPHDGIDSGSSRSVTAVAVGAELEISHSGETYSTSGSVLDLGPELLSTSKPITLTITNTGNSELELFSATFLGGDSADFNVSAFESDALPGGQSTDVTVSFIPQAVGQRSTTLFLHTSDRSDSLLSINLTGLGVATIGLEDFADAATVSRDADSDPDLDQITLLEEYAYNLDPTASDQQVLESGSGNAGLPSMRLVGDRLVIEFVRRTNDPFLTYLPEFGSEIDSLSAATETETITAIDSIFERVIIQDSESTSSANKRLCRVRVTYR